MDNILVLKLVENFPLMAIFLFF